MEKSKEHISDKDDEFLNQLVKSKKAKSISGASAQTNEDNVTDFLLEIQKEAEKNKKGRTAPVTFHAPIALVERIEKDANDLGISRSEYLVTILKKVYGA